MTITAIEHPVRRISAPEDVKLVTATEKGEIVLQNHSPIPSSEEDMTCSHASPKYKASTSTTHFLPTLAVRSLPDVTHRENREPGNGELNISLKGYRS